ncbi:hypothetical protein PO903_18560 [Paenibacillus sp. PK4536]|uniref:hypothetical protein n=1 Tax=Paenibacillus sp. PK4536 TaxID=3024576 RepID=UPI002358C63C|nr:hypothetical protein [Paenibacillus sp. PK4536]WIM38632.1 hypothetical protein PO903_18560 [Paenibacillus sp. PK4536]
MKIFFSLSVLILYTALLVGCNSEADKGSYEAIIKYNDQEYIGQQAVKTEQYPDVQQLGTIVEKVSEDKKPTENLSSNAVDKGVEVFQAPDGTLLAKTADGNYQIFELAKSSS